MKKPIKILPIILSVMLISIFSCQQEDSDLSAPQGIVRFGSISLEFEPMGSPGSRISGVSPWAHVFPNSADILFTNKVSNEEFKLEFNPNDFTTPYSISLPFGSYSFYSKIEAGVFSDFLPFEASGEFILNSQSLELSLQAKTDYGLISVKDKYVEKALVSNGTIESILILPEGFTYWYKYVKGESNVTLKIEESFGGSTVKRNLSILANRHYNFVLKLAEGSAAITNLILDPFELEEEEITIGSNSVFYEENGTIKCPQASPGDKGMVNDRIYEAVDRALLITRRDEGADLTCACTSLVTDMSGMFSGSISQRNLFNQNIRSWDVSNVVDMSSMFYSSYFNQNINNWDVSNVTNMSAMFSVAVAFNQPIGNWDVSHVTYMGKMFSEALSFNQPIGDWDVSNVTNMSQMFFETPFNQQIGNWDVSSVNDFSFMFTHTSFNQSIENWNVSNAKNMAGMFSESTFNQPIGNWDVSNVTNMRKMFVEAIPFNQEIGNWDVSNVIDMSGMFDRAFQFNQPIGNWNTMNVETMVEMFNMASKFNQPIGNWNVGKVLNMSYMFSWASNFNQPIGNWNVGSVISMKEMFYAAENFNQPIGNWNVSKVNDMSGMFATAFEFNQAVGDWDVSHVTNMGAMFSEAISFNQHIGDWDVSNVVDLHWLFNDAKNFNQNLTAWCVQNIPSEPGRFSTGSSLLDANKPIWGTCPE